MSIYTRTGDRGDTSLADGSRTRKDAVRVEAYGDLDEAGCWVGMARAAVTDAGLDRILSFLQQRLMNCASLAATPTTPAPGNVTVTDADVAALERAIDALGERSPAWQGFVLQGGSEAASRLHVARCAVRRAERRLVALGDSGSVDPQVLSFVNRASDLLYTAALSENAASGITGETWDPAAVPGF